MIPASSFKGILAMAVAMGMFVSNDTLLKLAMQTLPLGESIALRSAGAALLLAVVVVWRGDGPAVWTMFRGRVLMRSTFDTITTLTYVAALMVMPIASSTVIYMAAPLITVALSVPLLGEKVDWRRWSAVLVGFSGAVVVTRPDPGAFDAVALLPLVAAAFGSLRDISTRGIGLEIPGSVVALSTGLLLTLSAMVFAIWEPWRLPHADEAAYLAGAATVFAAGSVLLVHAFRMAPLGAVLPLRYLLVPGALISGYLVFGDVPDLWAGIGTLLVVGAGLYSIHRERVDSRAANPVPEARSGGLTLAAAAASAPPTD